MKMYDALHVKLQAFTLVQDGSGLPVVVKEKFFPSAR